MKRSMSLRGQESLPTLGTSGRFGGSSDQCFCHLAPCAIQQRTSSIWRAVSFLPNLAGGMRILLPFSGAVMRWYSSLSSGLPGMMTR
jgi:hypothetical protein